jgi:hypothetical protein
MHATVRARIPWTPTTEAEHAAVLRQMHRLLSSHHFRNSKRYPVLLEYLIRETLAGNSDSLKERVLGMAVFHRPADYDANADPVVRVTAGEIRKRIAQFYQEEGDTGDIYIDLKPGSYVPEFYPVPSHGDEIHEPAPFQPEAETIAPAALTATATGNKPAWRFPTFTLVTIVLLASAILAFVLYRGISDDQRSQMWYPLLNSPAPVLLVVGQPHAGDSQIPPADSEFERGIAGDLRLPDAIAMAHLSAVLDAHHRLYQITGVNSTSLSDLRKGPTILVGGFNNPWTLRVLSPLRFSLRSVGEGDSATSPQILQIIDRKNQSGSPWTLDLQQPVSAVTHDYAIIARFQANMTDGIVMVVAGLGAGGTESASKFVNSSKSMTQFAATAPSNWRNMNMEAVLETEVIGGRSGHAHVIAAEFW